jgi:hypothetical protein
LIHELSSSAAVFTIHGKDEANVEVIAIQHGLHSKGFFKKYRLPRTYAPVLRDELQDMGMSFTSIYPETMGR